MFAKTIKTSFLSLITLVSSCVLAGAAAVQYDFNSGLPAGTSIGGNAVVSPTNGIGNSGVVKLTPNLASQSGAFMVPDIAGGVAVTNFRARFKLLIGGSTCCDDAGTVGATGRARPADGFSFNFATGINPNGPSTCCWEEGSGNGLTVTLDTWDNNNGETAPSIELVVGGAAVAFQSMDGVRAGGAPAGPILTNAAGGLISLETSPAVSVVPNPTNFVDVLIELFADKTVSMSFSNVTVFNHVSVPSYNPIAGGTWVLGGRTGGATDNHWIDNVEISVNFTPGPASITQSPANQTVIESQTATFSIQVNGTPPYTIQWFSNNVAIAGANGLSYTTPVTTTNMSGTVYKATVQGAEGGVATSDNATLTVNPGVIALKADSRLTTNRVFVTFTKPVNLNGTYTVDNGVTCGTVIYGSSHSEVIIFTSQLSPGVTYTVTIAGVTGEDGSTLLPDPSMRSFRQSAGDVCTDFASLPAGSYVSGNAYLSNQVVHLTDALNGQVGAWIYTNYPAGMAIDRVHATFGVYVGGFTIGPQGADGMSFNLAGDIPLTAVCCGEGGFGTGFSVTIDSWDDGSGNDPSINVNWRGSRVGKVKMPVLRSGFVPMDINLDPDGTVDVTYDGITVFTNFALPNFNQIPNAKLGFFARTGGENDNHWITNLCVTHNYSFGPLSIVTEPADQSVYETFRATFQVVLAGSPPYTIQWYSNNVAIAGATGLTYTTPPTIPAMSGQLYHAVISNAENTVTTRDALLTVNPVIFFRTVAAKSGTQIRLTFSRAVALTGTYTVTGPGGAIANTKAYGANQSEVILTLATSLTPEANYTVNISGETGTDASPMIPDPSTGAFRYGFGAYCQDFSVSGAPGSAPPGTALYGDGVNSGYIAGGVLHLTDAANGVSGTFVISNRTEGLPVDRVYAVFRMQLGPGTAQPADGVSFNWGSDVLGPSSEEGIGTGLRVIFDTYPNDAATQPRFAVVWKGVQIATKGPVPNNQISKGVMVPVFIALDETGIFNLWYDNVQIFTNVALPNFGPIANSGYSLSGRTGNANEAAWVDDLCINNFLPGDIRFRVEPVDTVGLEGDPVTFSTIVDGQPAGNIPGGFYYQWFTNGIAVTGARSSSYTIPVAAEFMEGWQISVVASNNTTSVTSSNATLHVALNPRIVSAKMVPCTDNKVQFTFTREVDVDSGSYQLTPVTAAEAVHEYGANHKIVIVTYDAPLTLRQLYSVQIQDVMNEAQTLTLYPNPTTTSFRYGYLPITNDFNSVGYVPSNTVALTSIGNNMTIAGSAWVSNGIVHLTDTANTLAGALVVTNVVNSGGAVDRFVIRYRASLFQGGNKNPGRVGPGDPADGYSLNIAPGLPLTAGTGEDGTGSGLTVAFDNFDNGGGEAPSIDIRYNGVKLIDTTNSASPSTFKSPATIASIMRTGNGAFKDVYVDLEPDGKVTVIYDGVMIYNQFQTPFPGTMSNARVGLYGRTGGLNENLWIDDLQINNEAVGAPVIVRQPADLTLQEGGSAYVSVDVDGLPPYTYQWYMNGNLVPGATNSSIYTDVVNRGAEGRTYHAVINSLCGGPITTRDAVLHINQDTVAPVLLWVGPDQTYSSLVLFFSEMMDLASAQNAANYTLNNGVSVTAAAFVPNAFAPPVNGTNRYVRLTLSQPLNPVNCNVLAISNVTDISTFNAVNARFAIPMKAPLQTSGADNLVVIEAEDFDANRSPGFGSIAAGWVYGTSLPGSVGGYMDAAPNATFIDAADVVPAPSIINTMAALSSMDYAVNFVASGTYYIWARGSTGNDGANNSFQLLLDGGLQSNNQRQIGNDTPNWGRDGANVNKFGWVNRGNNSATTRAFITVPTPGVHLLTVVMREDGFKLDRFFLTTDQFAYTNLNTVDFNTAGPAATTRANLQNLAIVRDNPGNAQITWNGAGWKLQGTAGLSNNPAQTLWTDLPYTSPLTIPAGFFGPGETNVIFRLICK